MAYFLLLLDGIAVLYPLAAFCTQKNGFLGPKEENFENAILGIIWPILGLIWTLPCLFGPYYTRPYFALTAFNCVFLGLIWALLGLNRPHLAFFGPYWAILGPYWAILGPY